MLGVDKTVQASPLDPHKTQVLLHSVSQHGPLPSCLLFTSLFPCLSMYFSFISNDKEKGKGEKQWEISSIPWFTFQTASTARAENQELKILPGSLNIDDKNPSYWAKIHCFPRHVSKNLVRSKIAETQSGSQNTGVTNDALTCHATTPS